MLTKHLALDVVDDGCAGLELFLYIEKGLVYQSPIIKIHGDPIYNRPEVRRNKHRKAINNHVPGFHSSFSFSDHYIEGQTKHNKREESVNEQALEPIKFGLIKQEDTSIKGAN